MYAVVEFERKECSVVPLKWLIEEQKVCFWPSNIKKVENFESDYIAKQKSPMASWRKYKIVKIHFFSADYAEASKFIKRIIEESSSASENAGDHNVSEPLFQKPFNNTQQDENLNPNRQVDEDRRFIKRNERDNDFDSQQSKKQKTTDSSDEFSSEEDTQVEIPTEESLDTTITYASTSSTPASFALSNASNTPTHSNSTQLDNNLAESLLRRIERLIATQDQHSIMLDNIIRNQELTNTPCQRPLDFPKLPISNKQEYKAVEEFLSNDEKFTYMKKRLSTIGGSSVRNTTMNMLKFLLSNEVAMKFNWSGNNKRPFKKTKMYLAITDAVKLSYSGERFSNEVNDKVIKESIQDWLKLAKSRYSYSLKKK